MTPLMKMVNGEVVPMTPEDVAQWQADQARALAPQPPPQPTYAELKAHLEQIAAQIAALEKDVP
jgi:hypothetical protein